MLLFFGELLLYQWTIFRYYFFDALILLKSCRDLLIFKLKLPIDIVNFRFNIFEINLLEVTGLLNFIYEWAQIL